MKKLLIFFFFITSSNNCFAVDGFTATISNIKVTGWASVFIFNEPKNGCGVSAIKFSLEPPHVQQLTVALFSVQLARNKIKYLNCLESPWENTAKAVI